MNRGSGILIFDSDPIVTRLLSRILVTHGVQAYPVHSTREGMATYTEHRERIGLVLLNWDSPAKTELSLLDPDIRFVLLAEGLLEDRRAADLAALWVFPKPIPDHTQWIAKLRELIG